MFRLFFVFVFFFGNLLAQDPSDVRRILTFQDDLNKEFASEEKSPLLPKDLKQFKTLDFFKIDTSYCIRAKFVRTPYETPFIMKTTTGREPLYVKYGEAHFIMNEKNVVLNIYQNQGLKAQPEYEDYLFLPFTDLTNGEQSYAGGRFIDLKIPEGDLILIDFNTAYNPYCAYNDRYSCPIPPQENHLDFKIVAGVKKYKKYPDNE
ncbi:DUF1684 domain-containing protein [Aquimarina gracilis]|uniref:DUF1684 domain-containing protein n=1 Tax=Aquimarina gracilis TaxID=874422 RepID=A0ABU5ZR89_9FLAO|nr:DUF1684 domain-containing protein [Aquimarina gracilis]MEB3344590.1 DUF1684 domain-containing protein [Aquimarina gracilis]